MLKHSHTNGKKLFKKMVEEALWEETATDRKMIQAQKQLSPVSFLNPLWKGFYTCKDCTRVCTVSLYA